MMKTIEEKKKLFLENAKERFGDRFEYDLSNYEDSTTSIIRITDTETGNTWESSPRNHLRTKNGIPNSTRGYSTDFIISRIEDIFGKDHFEFIDPITEYSGYIRVRCLIHDEIFTTTPRSLFLGHNGCPRCYSELCSNTRWTKKVNQEESSIIIEDLLNQGKTFEQIGEILGISGHQAGVIAKKFNIIKPNPIADKIDNIKSMLENGDSVQCIADYYEVSITAIYYIMNQYNLPRPLRSHQSSSKGEIFVKKYLDEVLKIEYLEQTRVDLEKQTVLPDFLIEDYKESKIWIEYNGEQHYHEINFFSIHRSFQSQVDRDNLVRDYCKTNNIILIEIPYILDTYEKVEDFLNKTIIQGIDPSTLIDYEKLYN